MTCRVNFFNFVPKADFILLANQTKNFQGKLTAIRQAIWHFSTSAK